MKFSNLGIVSLALGRHNLRDPRLDEANRLVEAKKKIYAQVDIVGEEELASADAIVTTRDGIFELIVRDLDMVERRLEREPVQPELDALLRLRKELEQERTMRNATLSTEDRAALEIHSFLTARPVTVASDEELQAPDQLMLRAYRESDQISFLTVGGKENRAWPIRQGTSAWEAAGSIHSDLQRGFIRAEIISFDDFLAAGGDTEAKRAGKMRLETKEYVMQDCDITNFRFSGR